ncbi:pirin family protein [Dickeya dadantii]|uniref:pirin family protein n=1 Tax=Dickeya dadantii TaxID=204038 RepID=UPI001495D502|nr:pirin family protein [Dickeya dadantii]NPE52331.1 pirin family protein [Dickeya dadantii]
MAHPPAFSATTRAIVHRTSGQRLGPLTRLMTPGDLGQWVKPFVFLDLFESIPSTVTGFRPHPHSGIATLTTFLEGRMTYGDTTGKQGAMSAGSVEWMRAGSGVWHAGEPAPDHMMRGYQLWIALPPSLELAPAQSLYLEPERIERDGPARILLGRYGGATSPIPLPVSITYLHVRLTDGERWTYQPGADHDTAWLALNSGKLHVGDTVLERELAVFAPGNQAIEMTAEGDVELVIGSSAKHPYPLVTGAYSVHTSIDALAEGERTIDQLQHSPAFAALNRRTALRS